MGSLSIPCALLLITFIAGCTSSSPSPDLPTENLSETVTPSPGIQFPEQEYLSSAKRVGLVKNLADMEVRIPTMGFVHTLAGENIFRVDVSVKNTGTMTDTFSLTNIRFGQENTYPAVGAFFDGEQVSVLSLGRFEKKTGYLLFRNVPTSLKGIALITAGEAISPTSGNFVTFTFSVEL